MTDTGRGGMKTSGGAVWSEDSVLVKEGRREIRIEDERERSARGDIECDMEVAGDGGGAGNGLSRCLLGVDGADCILRWAAISWTINLRARSRSRSSRWSSSERRGD